jgi:alkanesulfonate monooxygenase SsuD/methylene tetrahydromethanopterin reductase-like flavin-dependent oxidoreductase (luciferase family)
MEEQIDLLRKLWTQPLVNFEGRWDSIPDAGINPLPVQQPIPIWMGGMSDAVQQRVARLADGWFPQRINPGPEAKEVLDRVRDYMRAAGRDPASLGLHVTINAPGSPPDDWAASASAWRDLGLTHVSFNTMGAGLATPRDHIEAIRKFSNAAGAVGSH